MVSGGSSIQDYTLCDAVAGTLREIDTRQVVLWDWGRDLGSTGNGYEGTSWRDGNVLRLVCGDGVHIQKFAKNQCIVHFYC